MAIDGTDAEHAQPDIESGNRINARALDAMPAARRFLDTECTHNGILTLRCQHGEVFQWDGLAYSTLGDSDLQAMLWKHLDTYASHVTNPCVSNIESAVKSLTNVPGSYRMPTWLDGDADFPAHEVLVTKAGLLHLPSLVSGKPSLLPPTPRYFSQNAVGYKFDVEATCPKWLRFLQSIWPHDPQSIEALQQLFGYLLLPATEHHKLFMLVGPPRSGKGTIGRTIKALVGPGNLASPTLASLSGPFGLWPLLNRTVALISDARLSGRADAVTIVERMLSISGEDPQDVHRKNLPTVAGTRLPVRFVVMTNELPSMRDASGAFMSRVLLIRMTESFYGREDKRLTHKLLQELPGILNWSIAGWQKLQDAGAFTQPESGRELLDDLRAISSPVAVFIDECCTVDAGASVLASDIFDAWAKWCQQHGREDAGSVTSFGKELRAAMTSLGTSRPRGEGGKREVVYRGIGLAT